MAADPDEELLALRHERERIQTRLQWIQQRGDIETSRYLSESLTVLDELIEERLRELADDSESL
ncbi:MAG: hypothetical protein ACRD1H_20785 [Vicinamibacterales bacterium]